MGGHSSGGLFPGAAGGGAVGAGSAQSVPSGSAGSLISEAQAQGLNISPDKVVGITKDPDGKIVWLETGSGGSRGSGLEHIIEEHGKQFNGRGISNSELPGYLLQAVHTGKVVGMQGSRPIYEFTYNGTRQRVAITVSDNGYIVGANPRSLPKEN
ncbi:MAG: hypothetical protein IJ111_10405 [Eggerthellaceae bacterium]|nr:hypothetical protein [Eggerthellaceae bacterium]